MYHINPKTYNLLLMEESVEYGIVVQVLQKNKRTWIVKEQ